MFYGQCNDCGQRWELGTANTCTCKEEEMKTLSEMAREAGLPEAWISKNGVLSWEQLKRFSKLARADEREACARVCDDWPNGRDDVYSIGVAIRARGNT